jgi:hypothetical protein
LEEEEDSEKKIVEIKFQKKRIPILLNFMKYWESIKMRLRKTLKELIKKHVLKAIISILIKEEILKSLKCSMRPLLFCQILKKNRYMTNMENKDLKMEVGAEETQWTYLVKCLAVEEEEDRRKAYKKPNLSLENYKYLLRMFIKEK